MLYFRVFANRQSGKSPVSFLGLSPIPRPRFANSFACHRSNNSPVSPAIATDPKTHVSNPFFATHPRPPGIFHFGSIDLSQLAVSISGPYPSWVTVHGARSTFPYPLSFQILPHSFPQRPLRICFSFNQLHTLFIATEGVHPCPLPSTFKRFEVSTSSPFPQKCYIFNTMRDESKMFATVEEAVEEIRQGRMVVLVDDEDRENEGDLAM